MKYKDFKVMSQNEMKNVKGGSETPPASCQAKVALANGGFTVYTGLTSAEAQNQEGMVNWCCESCSSTSWAI